MIASLIIFYIVFLLIFIIFSAAGLYHLWRYGYVGDLTRPVIIIYLVLSLLVIGSSIILIVTRLLMGG